MSDSREVTVALCVGKSCRDWTDQSHRRLRKVSVDDELRIVEVTCLDVCKGPVAVVDADGPRPVVGRRMRSKKAWRALLAASRDPEARLPKPIRVTRKKAAKAVARAQRRLAKISG